MTIKDIRQIVGENLSALRSEKGMTQSQLAEQLNYSDKAISKWERGESLPDITVLKSIADLFDVTLDYLVQPEHPVEPEPSLQEQPPLELESTELESAELEPPEEQLRRKKHNRGFITGMSILVVWLLAALAFMVLDIVPLQINGHWLAYLYAVPVSMIVWIVLNSTWFSRRLNFLIVSILMWSLLLCIFLTVAVYGWLLWQVFTLGVPGQAIIILWSRLRHK